MPAPRVGASSRSPKTRAAMRRAAMRRAPQRCGARRSDAARAQRLRRVPYRRAVGVFQVQELGVWCPLAGPLTELLCVRRGLVGT